MSDLGIRGGLTRWFIGDLAGSCGGSSWEAIVASLVVLGVVMIIAGACIGAFLRVSFAIRKDDRARGTLRFDAPDSSARTARALVGISSSRWD
jgi:hypothetical protein